ncbi:hypothetical protein HJ588_04355 [Flexivirga sp. ID2601S]|uniref:Carrier domain-containing protein n=1 Tax=Flexivirga aerilata TaxID=1656889 RepID=A0A849AF35_9MICO|nr:phosphopantetheine-binding protein [Flexivirga aerilata]NNG38507.1 hypothetical protein [Flexivirga aerilata]
MTTTRTDQDTLAMVIEAMRDMGIDGVDITPDTHLREDLDVDSAELVELVTDVAGQAPDGKALKHVRTVAELVTFLDGGAPDQPSEPIKESA